MWIACGLAFAGGTEVPFCRRSGHTNSFVESHLLHATSLHTACLPTDYLFGGWMFESSIGLCQPQMRVWKQKCAYGSMWVRVWPVGPILGLIPAHFVPFVPTHVRDGFYSVQGISPPATSAPMSNHECHTSVQNVCVLCCRALDVLCLQGLLGVATKHQVELLQILRIQQFPRIPRIPGARDLCLRLNGARRFKLVADIRVKFLSTGRAVHQNKLGLDPQGGCWAWQALGVGVGASQAFKTPAPWSQVLP
eukprot:366199-Chlamydomonas_euryale.AAC.4